MELIEMCFYCMESHFGIWRPNTRVKGRYMRKRTKWLYFLRYMVTISNNKVRGIILISFCSKSTHLKKYVWWSFRDLFASKLNWQAQFILYNDIFSGNNVYRLYSRSSVSNSILFLTNNWEISLSNCWSRTF